MRRMYSNTQLIELIQGVADGQISKLFEANDKKYKFVAGVIRNDGGTWKLIDNETHTSINIESITQTNEYINVAFTPEFKKVISFIAVSDEDFDLNALCVGASVTPEYANIYITKPNRYGGYVYFDGSSWQVGGDVSAVGSLTAENSFPITHSKIESGYLGRFVTPRDTTYKMIVSSANTEVDEVQFYDSNGDIVTTPDTHMKFWIGATGDKKYRINPADANQDGNIWLFGILEL